MTPSSSPRVSKETEARHLLLERACRDILAAIGEDPERPGLLDTPARFARMWQEFAYYHDPSALTTFEAVSVDQMVVVSGIRVYSMCEHHLLPFWCDITIGYITGEKVLGLSKFARVARRHAHRLQMQERLVADIRAELVDAAGTESVAVYATGEHLCLSMRGARAQDHRMISSALGGAFKRDLSTRAEFFAIARNGGPK